MIFLDNLYYYDADSIVEGFVNQIFMGLKIHPHQNLDVTLKKHSYPGFLKLIEKTNNIKDLEYLKRDVHNGINTIKTIKDKIDKCERLGDCKETHKYYKGIYDLYINKGITVEDCELTIKWNKEVCLKAISDKIKSIKENEKNK